MPRRNINARERVEKKWELSYIRALMKKLKEGSIPEAEEHEIVNIKGMKKGK